MDIVSERDMYKKGFLILIDYWDCLPDEEKINVHEKLMKIGL